MLFLHLLLITYGGLYMKFRTIPEMFIETCDKYQDSRIAFRYKNRGEYQTLTHNQLREKVECLALGLLEMGLHKGDRIGLVSENRIEWIITSLAISTIGAIDVPIFPILTAKQEEYIFSNCDASAIIVSNNFQLNKVLEFKENLSSLRHIIVMNDEYNAKDVFVRSLNEVMARGASLKTPTQRRDIFLELSSKINEDDILSIIYTSGTTGNPKGVVLSHKNVCSDVVGSKDALLNLESDESLSYLPLCHTFERSAGFYLLFASGSVITLAESIDSIAKNILEIKPTLMTTVPKLLETLKKKIYASMERESASKRKVFDWAINIGKKKVRLSQEGKTNPFINAQYALAEKLVFNKIREKLGGRLLRMVSGGAALAPELAEFFLAIGVTIYEGYGLTEASPIVAVNTDLVYELGTVGPPLPNIEVKIAEDGEILVRGPIVMKGYWKDDEATNMAIDSDGWLYTGDIGCFTEKGSIKITDRKKNIFVSSGGKNIAPQPIENLLTQSRYIEQCFLVGDSREYCTALITPNFEQLKQLATEFDINFDNESDLINNDKIINHIRKEIDYIQKDLSKFERVRKFSFLPKPFTVESGELSPKMSVRRHVVEKNYFDMIEKMYNDD